MTESKKKHGLGTLVTHLGEFQNPYNAHLQPIYQTATYSFPDVATGAATFKGEQEGYIYTRLGGPNSDLLAKKIAALEAYDINADRDGDEVTNKATGLIFASGMAAISATLLACAKAGDTLIVQEAVYGNTFLILQNIAPRLGLNIVWVKDPGPEQWEAAFRANPGAVLAYAESPVNPTMAVVDLASTAEIAHRHGAWLVVDNTFATPYCQRPLTLGADIVVHATTKYLTGHGAVIGGAVVSKHIEFMKQQLLFNLKYLGATPSPFDCWLTNLGLKTFELRMQRHCDNALKLAVYLEQHRAVERVYYPGLESFGQAEVARRQMNPFGGMLAFELKGGMQAGENLLNHVRVATLAVSLGNLDTLIQHPASMTHSSVPREERVNMGLTDGLVRLSVGVENIEDLLDDFDQALKYAD